MLINSLLFDLDGTLLDTAPDLVSALNAVLQSAGREPVAYAKGRQIASRGVSGLLKLGFNITAEDPQYPALAQAFLTYYSENIATHTHLFAGMAEVLAYLDERSLPWGIVTNKPGNLTQLLLEKLNLHTRARCIISGDTLAVRKPHPQPLLHACTILNTQPNQCIYIGDAQCDIEAGQRAGMRTILARYGYIAEDDDPASWRADKAIDHPLEIIDFLTLTSPANVAE